MKKEGRTARYADDAQRTPVEKMKQVAVLSVRRTEPEFRQAICINGLARFMAF